MPQPLPRFLAHEQKAADLAKLADILLAAADVDDSEPKLVRKSADGHDPARLRGLPAIGRNVSGAMPGTDPLRALLAKEGRGRRRR